VPVGFIKTVIDHQNVFGATGGFTGAVSLAVSGLPSSVSAAFNPATVTNFGASTLTFAAAASAPSQRRSRSP
jgi:hypothetical protein